MSSNTTEEKESVLGLKQVKGHRLFTSGFFRASLNSSLCPHRQPSLLVLLIGVFSLSQWLSSGCIYFLTKPLHPTLTSWCLLSTLRCSHWNTFPALLFCLKGFIDSSSPQRWGEATANRMTSRETCVGSSLLSAVLFSTFLALGTQGKPFFFTIRM